MWQLLLLYAPTEYVKIFFSIYVYTQRCRDVLDSLLKDYPDVAQNLGPMEK